MKFQEGTGKFKDLIKLQSSQKFELYLGQTDSKIHSLLTPSHRFPPQLTQVSMY